MRGSVNAKNEETERRNLHGERAIEDRLSESNINQHQQLSGPLWSTCLIDDFIWKKILQKFNFLLFTSITCTEMNR